MEDLLPEAGTGNEIKAIPTHRIPPYGCDGFYAIYMESQVGSAFLQFNEIVLTLAEEWPAHRLPIRNTIYAIRQVDSPSKSYPVDFNFRFQRQIRSFCRRAG